MTDKSEKTADFFSNQKKLVNKHEYKSSGFHSFASYTIKTQDKAESVWNDKAKMALLKEHCIDWNPVQNNGSSIKFKLSTAMVLDDEKAWKSDSEILRKGRHKVGYRIGEQSRKRDFIEELMGLAETSTKKAEVKAQAIAEYKDECAIKLAKELDISIEKAKKMLA